MPTNEEMQAELERLRPENETLKQSKRGGSVPMKVSEKGAVPMYGLGPLPCYALQGAMDEAAMAAEIKQFVEETGRV